jgi:hypothetical protein
MPAGYQKWPPKFTDKPYTTATSSSAGRGQYVALRHGGR